RRHAVLLLPVWRTAAGLLRVGAQELADLLLRRLQVLGLAAVGRQAGGVLRFAAEPFGGRRRVEVIAARQDEQWRLDRGDERLVDAHEGALRAPHLLVVGADERLVVIHTHGC